MTPQLRAAPTADGLARAVGLTTEAVRDGGPLPDGATAELLAATGFEGKVGQAATASTADGEVSLLVGLGDAEDMTLARARKAGALAAREARRLTGLATTLVDDVLAAGPHLDRPAVARAVAEGVGLKSYAFDRYLDDPEHSRLEEVVLLGDDGDAVGLGARVADAVCLTRDLVNEPGGSLTPTALAEAASEVAQREDLQITILGLEEIREQRLGGLLGVNRGSTQPPVLIQLAHEPEGAGPDTPTLALVGKGITFDAGGLDIKTAEGMLTMKCDMAGAGAVLGAMSAVAAVAPGVRVAAYLPSTDNMLGPDATRPGDVLTIRGGTTVEIGNTDAEGRLILADALHLAVEGGPAAIVDVATLTGACMVALGTRWAGLMGSHDGWLDQVEAAAGRSGEPVWRLPLPQEYREQLDSPIADLKNVGSRYGGALTAGLFLKEFTGDVPWAHLDIAGPAFSEEALDLGPKGGTGFAVRTLLELARTFEDPSG